MCHLLETIKLENGVLHNLKYHNLRFNSARRKLFGASEVLNLDENIKIPEACNKGLYRCRIVYSEKIEKIEFVEYQVRTFKSLKIVRDDTIEYNYKYTNRDRLNQLFAMREACDEIIIVKNGLVTDCTIGNLVFFDGQKWHTPSSPLLNGTRRMQLLEEAQICETEISFDSIASFQKVGIINVFYGMENLPIIPVSAIF